MMQSIAQSLPLSLSLSLSLCRLCDDYLSLYRQAAGNIRENTGDTVPEATLRLLVNKMLEEVCVLSVRGEGVNHMCVCVSLSAGSAWLPERRVGVSLGKGVLIMDILYIPLHHV